MTTTYDFHHAVYYDAADVREERDRVFDLCHGCRLCWNICPSFVSLFDLIDNVRGDDPKALTEAEHDRVVDECYQCKLCYLKCPYVPPHEWELDFPRLMLRSLASRTKQDGVGVTKRFLAATDFVGKAATMAAPLANAANRSGLARGVMQRTIGVAKDRLLPDYAKVRFSKWYRGHRRARVSPAEPDAPKVALFPTCIVEYQQPEIGKDTVAVYEHNGIDVSVPDGLVCCGMPWLDAGDVGKFAEHAAKNVPVLARAVAEGRDIVVPQPTCGYVIKKEYGDVLGCDEARTVAGSTYDVCEYLVRLNKEGKLKTEFPGEVHDKITWHVPCHLRAQQIGPKSRDLMALTGAEVNVVERCAGIDGTWGYRKENYELAREVAQPMAEAIKAAGAVVAGDCHLAGTAITQETGRVAVHPIQILARAYGLTQD